MNYAQIYQRQILKDFSKTDFIESFEGKLVEITEDKLEVKHLNGKLFFSSPLNLYEVDEFSGTKTFLGFFQDGSKFRLLRPSEMTLIHFLNEYNCEDAFSISSIGLQDFAIHFILTKNYSHNFEVINKGKEEQISKLLESSISAFEHGLITKFKEFKQMILEIDPNYLLVKKHPLGSKFNQIIMNYNPERIKTGVSKELFRAIQAKFNKRNAINIDEAVEVAAFCLAVNHKILEKKMPPNMFDDSVMDYFLEAVFTKMLEIFPNHYNSGIGTKIIENYEEIIQSPICEILINSHYDDLYGPEDGNVI